eukprot:363764-Chlamydomonas_euryale.AAC.24
MRASARGATTAWWYCTRASALAGGAKVRVTGAASGLGGVCTRDSARLNFSGCVARNTRAALSAAAAAAASAASFCCTAACRSKLASWNGTTMSLGTLGAERVRPNPSRGLASYLGIGMGLNDSCWAFSNAACSLGTAPARGPRTRRSACDSKAATLVVRWPGGADSTLAIIDWRSTLVRASAAGASATTLRPVMRASDALVGACTFDARLACLRACLLVLGAAELGRCSRTAGGRA